MAPQSGLVNWPRPERCCTECPPTAFANPIFDAVGVRINNMPLAAERVLAALPSKAAEDILMDVDALKRAEGLEV